MLRLLLTVLCLTPMALLADAQDSAHEVSDFVLADQHGTIHRLYEHKDKAAVVIMIQGNGCPIVRNALGEFRALRDTYTDKDVEFFMLNANLQDQADAILREARTYGIDLPVLHDKTQQVGESLNLIRTAEVLIINPENWSIAYRGPINDRQGYERQKPQATHHYAAEAIDRVVTGLPVAEPKRETLGCLINFPRRQYAPNAPSLGGA